jgi:GDSL-like Lipase/Acylhydrolase family/FG-GAP-like repeat
MKSFPNVLVWTVSLLAIVPQSIAATLPSLRILPLGDSITKGSLSTDGNGYRNYLETKLRNFDSDSLTEVDMIGTLRDGSMTDNDHEGHTGEFVEDIVTYWQKPFIAEPNVVLVHVGTNNMDLNQNVAEAPGLYSTMLDEMHKKLPHVMIIVCKVIHSKSADLNARAAIFNTKLEDIVQKRRVAGWPIAIIEMDLVDSDINDSKHPTDLGYAKLANGWYQAIVAAYETGLIRARGTSNPTGVGVGAKGNDGSYSGTAGCDGGNWKRVGKIFDEFNVWEEHGPIKGGADNFGYDKLILADLDGDGFDDYIIADDDGRVRAWKNSGGKMTSLGYIQPDWSDLKIKGDMIRMADVDGDGKADIIALYSDGAAKVWKNTGDGTKFEALDSKWATGLAAREKIRMLDMDGDGYADYVVLNDGGAVSWARNTHNNGADGSKNNWESLVEIAPGVAGVASKSVHLVDLDGDKRAGKFPLFITGTMPIISQGV